MANEMVGEMFSFYEMMMVTMDWMRIDYVPS